MREKKIITTTFKEKDMCNCNKKKTQIINIISSGIPTTTEQIYYVEILQKLCKKYCINSNLPLVQNLTFSLLSLTQSGQDNYLANIQVQGSCIYTPYQSCECNQQFEAINEIFTLPINATGGTPTVSIVSTMPIVSPANVAECCTLSNECDIECVLTLTITPVPTTAT